MSGGRNLWSLTQRGMVVEPQYLVVMKAFADMYMGSFNPV